MRLPQKQKLRFCFCTVRSSPAPRRLDAGSGQVETLMLTAPRQRGAGRHRVSDTRRAGPQGALTTRSVFAVRVQLAPTQHLAGAARAKIGRQVYINILIHR